MNIIIWFLMFVSDITMTKEELEEAIRTISSRFLI